jgi:TPR repeat protein
MTSSRALFTVCRIALALAFLSGCGDGANKGARSNAEDGNPASLYETAERFSDPRSATYDLREAFKWMRKASESGHASAQLALAGMYERGEGVEKDAVEASRWLLRAAMNGNSVAQRYIGPKYYFGVGLPKDYVEAYAWFNIAAANSGISGDRQFRDDVERELTPIQVMRGQERSAQLTREIEGLKSKR